MLLISIAVISLLSGALVCFGCDAFSTLNWFWLLPVTALGFFVLLAALGFLFVLYLCKRVCSNLGHTITAKSKVDTGTTIEIDLSQATLEIE